MTSTERERIEDEAEEFAKTKWKLDNTQDVRPLKLGYIAGAIAEHDKVRNQAIDDVIKRLSIIVHYGNIDLSWSFIKEEIEHLKTKP